MNEKKRPKISLYRVVVIGCVILVTLHLILLGTSFQRRAAANKLQTNQAVLEQNINALIQINENQSSDLESELESTQAELAGLQSSFPEYGAPFAIYKRGMDLAHSSNVELLGIARLGFELQETTSGSIQMENFLLDVKGNLGACLTYIQQLEQAGLDTVLMENVSIQPEQEQCTLEVRTVGFPQVIE